MDIGQRVRQAREALGYTQQELAGAVHLIRDAILSIERGERKVKADELWRIARELERPIVFFLQDSPAPELATAARRGTSATREAKRAELWLRRHFDDYQQLLHILRRDGHPSVSLDWAEQGMIVDQARSAAEVQRSHHNLGDRPVPDLREHLEDDVGVAVFGQRVDDADFCGILLLAPEGRAAVMLVNEKLLTSRRNFTMAHEYGHLLWKLKRQEATDDVFYRNPAENEEEMFANAFAASFLAPDGAVRAKAREIGRQIASADGVMDLACEFGLSFLAATYRLQNLGLLRAEEAESLRDTVRPTALPSFRWERQAFSAMSPLYWDLVLQAYTADELEAARCGEMVDMSALEFDELIDEIGEEVVSERALLEAAG